MVRRPMPTPRLVLFSAAATLLFFLLAELAARLAVPADCTSSARFSRYLQAVGSRGPEDLETSLKRSVPMPYDPYLIWHPVLNYRGPNLGVEVVHNSQGLRSPEIPFDPPPGTSRVLLLGDSTIYGHGVPAGATLRDVLEAELKQRLPGSTVEVINGGVPGYSSLQSLNQLRRLTGRYHPDVVVIANLWSDCALDTFEDKVVIYGKGVAVPWHRAAQWIDEVLAPRSALYCLARRLVYRLRHQGCRGRPPLCGPDEAELGKATNLVSQPGTSRPPASRPRVRLADYRANLRALVARVRRLHAVPVFLMLACGVELGEFEDPEGTMGDYQAYRRVMRDVAEETGTLLLELPPLFRRLHDQGLGPLFLDRVHPNATGHRIMADALARFLVSHQETRRALVRTQEKAP